MFTFSLPNDWLLRAGYVGSWIVRLTMWFGLVALPVGLVFIALAEAEAFNELDAQLLSEGVQISGRAAMLIIFSAVLIIVALFERILHDVQRIILSVSEGDPFIPINAARLERIGWMMLGTQIIALLGMSIRAVEALVDEWNFSEQFSLEGLFAVILIFILARVFRRGTEMRDDLEGTI